MSGRAPRAAAARVLDAVLHHGRSLKAELSRALPALPDPRDRALVEAICFAALRQRARADAALAAWMPKPPGRRDGDLRALLHVGFAQLDPLGLAPHAAVGETVDAARDIGRAHQAKLVNALLRRAQREGLPASSPADAWPAWLRDGVAADWPGDADAIFAASALPAPTWLRVNRRRGGRDAYLARLQAAGIEAVADDTLDDALRLPASIAVGALPGFAEGDVSIQDGAAQAVADALAPPAGARVLDACAAPGGKSAHLLERDPTLRLLALDVDPARLSRVRDTWRRLDLGEGIDPGVTACVADAAEPGPWWDGEPFDAILVDAPCSATGIVRRQPDVLLHRRAADIDALVALQARLLDTAWTMLRPGGVLVYATCSILRAENHAQVDAFLARTVDAVADPLPEHFGRAPAGDSAPHARQRLPGDGGMDGFFLARLAKRPG
ncbi:16S rRNA (cytosine(967)-C(5))-methyltransferase RsmB [Luteimonas sp. MC1750]|uniref:16S rRNA (cytosine(967)-C(5))-methyltransferase RsmB n=1 Tax=Luteimonas sp. MC1750 TaxID=2799326 RepID=UPI0018F065C3|nr:16S rRNA (cytosine(967)-C(5))-methyltransferase RsmB [Luteimonas sp. MC1750]MBJ6985036.1 16S rRNA (cytosine(967)-C(5))-methyltransferase RsmB [Luteimonas sp. MC1750]QQO05702.1 16S rRNA (cytosine(967)-C(5))-methyltransferase RsmB [Luteimonas sp. MC1750]